MKFCDTNGFFSWKLFSKFEIFFQNFELILKIFEISKKKISKKWFFSSGGSLSITQLHFKDPIAIFEHQFLTFKAFVGDKYQTKIASCLEKIVQNLKEYPRQKNMARSVKKDPL